MSTRNPYAVYQRTAVETASSTKLIVMLYDGAIRFLMKVGPAMRTKNYREQSMYITKAQKIIKHLYGNLDFEKAGDVAKTLADTYVRMYDMLTAAHIKDDPERVEKVLYGLRELREAWVEVDRQTTILHAAPAQITPEDGRTLARAA